MLSEYLNRRARRARGTIAHALSLAVELDRVAELAYAHSPGNIDTIGVRDQFFTDDDGIDEDGARLVEIRKIGERAVARVRALLAR